VAAMGLLEEVYRLPMVPPTEASRRRIVEAVAAARIGEMTPATIR
jgi:dihydrodipicolinate synthase/N-acetylneuraminate lyase